MKNLFLKNNIKKYNLSQGKRLSGFTLIETLVAVTLFTFVSFVAISALFQMQSLNTKLKITKNIYNNIFFTMDIITSEIKQGSNFENKDYYSNTSSPINCDSVAGGDSCIVFDYLNIEGVNSSEQRGYYLSNSNRLMRYNVKAGIVSSESITSEDLKIEKLKFILEGNESYSVNGDTQQPMVKIILKGTTISSPKTPFYIETIVSQRSLTN